MNPSFVWTLLFFDQELMCLPAPEASLLLIVRPVLYLRKREHKSCKSLIHIFASTKHTLKTLRTI